MERKITPITQSSTFSLYDVSPQIKDFKTYIISTPETRQLCTNPFLVGKEYRESLGKAMTKTLMHEKIKSIYSNSKDEQLNVLNLLRGSLNFEILEALGKINKNKARASFMTSERKKENASWKIQDDQYNKINFADESIVFIGDIIATGSTLKSAMQKICELDLDKKIKHIFLYTIGGEEAEKILAHYHKLFEKNSYYGGSTLIFVEGMFHMATKETPARIKIEGTDLIPWKCPLTPEFEQDLFDSPIKALERCIVYDGGSRGFHPSHHYEDLLEYANQIREELEKGATLFELIEDRWQNAQKIPENKKSEINKTGLSWVEERTKKINEFIVN